MADGWTFRHLDPELKAAVEAEADRCHETTKGFVMRVLREVVTKSDTFKRSKSDTKSHSTPARPRWTREEALGIVTAYCREHESPIDPAEVVDYYASQNWKKANGRPLIDLAAGVRTFERHRKEKQASGKPLSQNDASYRPPPMVSAVEIKRQQQAEAARLRREDGDE